jgi:hypothetical protein
MPIFWITLFTVTLLLKINSGMQPVSSWFLVPSDLPLLAHAQSLILRDAAFDDARNAAGAPVGDAELVSRLPVVPRGRGSMLSVRLPLQTGFTDPTSNDTFCTDAFVVQYEQCLDCSEPGSTSLSEFDDDQETDD